MFRSSHVRTESEPASNDNGVFGIRRLPAAPRSILAVAAQVAGPISASYLADGVIIIRRGEREARAA
jgi:hypothetical protein